MADISAVSLSQYQTIGTTGQNDGTARRPLPGNSGNATHNPGVSVDISNVGKALGGLGKKGLSDAEEKELIELQQRDRDVRAHEQAHIAAGGGLVRGGAVYQYQAGPDGHLYAVAGEVSIDTSPVPNNPEATIRKAEQIKRAAEAPADPSSQDRSVAVEADEMETKAREQEISQKSGGKSTQAASTSAMSYGVSGHLMDKPKPLSDAAIG